MELKEAYAKILTNPTDLEAFREIRHRYTFLVRTIAEGPTADEIENGIDGPSRESDTGEKRDEEEDVCAQDHEWRNRMMARAQKEGQILKTKFLDPLVQKTPEELNAWRKEFTGNKVGKRSRQAPTVGAKDGLRAMLLRGFETLDEQPSLGVREALRREFEALLAVPGAFHGPTKRRVRKVDESLGTSWGRVWIRLAQADRLSGDWSENPPTKRKLRWDEPKVRDGEWVYCFRSVVDAVNKRLEERIREATGSLEPSTPLGGGDMESESSSELRETYPLSNELLPESEKTSAGSLVSKSQIEERSLKPKRGRGRPKKTKSEEEEVSEKKVKTTTTSTKNREPAKKSSSSSEMSVFELLE